VQGLVVPGRTYENSSSIRKACNFLLLKQLSTGGWGETYPSNETEVILNFLYLTMRLFSHFSLIFDRMVWYTHTHTPIKDLNIIM